MTPCKQTRQVFTFIIMIKMILSQNAGVVFSPFYINKLDFSQTSTSTPLQVQIAQDRSFVFASIGQDGILIMDETGKNIIYQQKLKGYYIKNFDVSSNGEYLIVGQLNQLIVFQKNDSQQEFEEVENIDFSTEISVIAYGQTQNIIVAAGVNGYIVVYDASDMKNLNKLDDFNTLSSIINSIYISKDSRFIYLGCDFQGTEIFEFIDQGRDQILGKRIGKIQLAAQGKGTQTTVNTRATQDNTYVYEIDTWYGLYYANCKDILLRKKDEKPIELNFKSYWPFHTIIPTCTTMILSNEDNFILVGARSQGIIIFDNRNREDIKLFQIIKIKTLVLSITMSRTQEYLYLSNSQSILTFIEDTANLNDFYPNLFNIQQAKELSSPGNYKWRCMIYGNEDYLIGIFDLNGVYIIPYYGNPYNLKTEQMKILQENPDSGYIDPTGKYFIFPTQLDNQVVKVFQIAPLDDSADQQKINLLNPVLVSSLYMEKQQVSESLVFSQDRKYAIVTFSIGLLLIDASNLLDLKLLYIWRNKQDMQGENQGAAITSDNKWILSTIRMLGIYLLNAEDKTNLILSDFVLTFGGENVLISQISDQYAYLIDGVNGFAIIDLTKVPKINILSRVPLQGWSVMCMLLSDEKFALVTTMEDGMLSLIDMQDKTNPLLISTFGYGRQFGNAVCGPKSQEYIFITTPQSIITLPLISPVKIHTDVSEIIVNQISGLYKINKLNKQANIKQFDQKQNEFTFLIGQQIQFNFAILYPQHDDMNIIDIKQYKDGQVFDLPSYITYDSNTQKVTLNICKEQLDSVDRFSPKLNTLLIKIAIPLIQSQFEFTQNDSDDRAIISTDQAEEILNYLLIKDLIDSKYVVTSNFESTKVFTLDQIFLNKLINPQNLLSQDEISLISQQLSEKIKLTLMKSIVINPIKFYIQNSLKYDLNDQKQFLKSTYSANMIVQMNIEIQYGQFVRFNYLGVQIKFSEQLDQIIIDGTVDSVNRVLSQKILFANKTNIEMNSQTNSTQKITVQIYDNLNYPISFSEPINKFKFIQAKERIIANQQEPLQQQINNQYANGIIDIETEISFSFAQNSFIVSNSSDISYQIQYLVNSSYQNVTPELVIQFQTDSRLNFRGIINSNNYREVYHFKVIASDGYTSAEDYFSLKIYGIPYFYVLNILLKVLGPLLGLIGIYRKRCVFYNIIFKKSVTFSREIIQCNCDYKKKIVLLGKSLQDSKMITYILFAKINSLHSKRRFSKQIETIEQVELKIREELSPKSQQSNEMDLPQDKINDTDLFEQEYEVAKKLYQQQLFKQDQVSNITNSKKLSEQLRIMKAYKPLSQVEKRYLKPNGSFSMSKIIKDIFQLKLLDSLSNSSNLSRINDYSIDLKNFNSRIYRAVRANVARHFLNLDKKSLLVYDYIKFYCYNYIQKSATDWYKGIVNIEQKIQQPNEKNLIIFPDIEFKIDNLNKILSSLSLIDNSSTLQPKSFEQLIKSYQQNQITINLFLIKEVIIADVLGFSSNVPTAFQPSIGESIHLQPYDIKQIIAFKKINSGKWIRPILQFFNLEYASYGVSKNMRLPSWIYLDQKHGMITFEGIPQTEDIEEILIRIYDVTGYVIKQFKLEVIAEQINTNNNNNFSIPDEQNYQVQPQKELESNTRMARLQTLHSSIIFNNQDKQIINRSPRQIGQRSRYNKLFPSVFEKTDSPFTSPRNPFSLKDYEFQRKSNAKNIFQDEFNDTAYNFTLDKVSDNSQEINKN